jgi:4-hydroxy-tetrahydrodipicolinate synthase
MRSALLTEAAHGVYVISATPFTDAGALDPESTDRLVDFYLERRVHGITVLGLMGEAQKLSPDEAIAFVGRILKRVAGRLPVVVGVSTPGVANLTVLAHRAMDLGASGVMIAPVPGLRGEDAVFTYFDTVFAALGGHVPVCLQDYPQDSGVYLSVSTVNRIIDAFPQLVIFKHEDCPGLGKLSRLRADSVPPRRRVSILVGNGGLYYPLELRRGADGAMTGFAYPEMLVDVYERFTAGDADGAEDVYDLYLPLVRYEQQPGFGLAVRKEILRRRGVIRSARTRLPGPALGPSDHAELDTLLTRLERKLKEGATGARG